MGTKKAAIPVSQTRRIQKQKREKVLQAFIKGVQRGIKKNEASYGLLASELRAVFLFALSNRLAFPDRPLNIESVYPKGTHTFEKAQSREWSFRGFCEMSLSATCGQFSDTEVRVIFAELLVWLGDELRKSSRSKL